MRVYLEAGAQRAMALGNRGPIRFTADGKVHPDILDAYWRCGFYVFEGVLGPMNLPTSRPTSRAFSTGCRSKRARTVDAQRATCARRGPDGADAVLVEAAGRSVRRHQPRRGRHPVKMFEPQAAADAPKEVVYLILGSLQFSEAHLRVYGHPHLLAVAAAVNGDDFVPFNEAMFIKEPGRGASVAWHQDGLTHWNSPEWDQGSHGFNFMAQLYGCTPANGVWVVPGSHKLGKPDIKAMVAAAGSERLPDAVPIICAPGDVAITNRQAVHGSFANTSKDWRVTLNFGFPSPPFGVGRAGRRRAQRSGGV